MLNGSPRSFVNPSTTAQVALALIDAADGHRPSWHVRLFSLPKMSLET